ncbi:hypothetical protein DDB_G0269658 [Dictyostelium discoideum AX4]|uniref:Alpha N-terminal protein methyltransferase 1 n=1 Tax=Dictyostelium discoideum TaxID=44689 RepID=NTM1_DICDI|nr:hypothetical protein DDB_G0269658 [Dictyostelium discoideum AX4]Q55DH6.1 RecName: Full=Alpha N-terminal protein methyltransferase 1; AltName: Full=X-Pro-Lys N-terminal protein methyltransferase 1; Short=NTM1 [Dictyostelium discoideum]EAL72179.1 hypothetical protein DDB_G0269658 [Dictyostelium discoideum AX4]|eukprot:XP_646155.1 hypothetical protein DDB_G0269658 [Dictyostelium discoideum AX4]
MTIKNEEQQQQTNKLKYPKNLLSSGLDGEGNTYINIEDLWKKELEGKDNKMEDKWYKSADEYWKGVEATVDGMLGGLAQVSPIDVVASKVFIQDFIKGTDSRPPINLNLALDCGAGIGRVAKEFLLPIGFKNVDLVEQNKLFLDKAKSDNFKDDNRVENYYAVGLQDFTFEKKYDCIWIQWVIGHLHDLDFIEFLKKCMDSLTPNGIICIKDNCAKKRFIMDKEDNSVSRTEDHLKYLFDQAGCKLLKSMVQPNFPKELFPVLMFALERK